MGAAIAAHLANAGLRVRLLDIPAEGRARRRPRGAQQDRGRRAGGGAQGQAGRVLLAALRHAGQRRQPGGRPGRGGRRQRRRHRGHHRKPGDQAGAVRPHRRDGRPRHHHLEHLGAAHRRADAGAQRRLPRALLHHPLLQPAPLPEAGRDRRRPRHHAGDARARRGAVRRPPGQGPGPRQGHAQLHRQPHRHVRADAHARARRSTRATRSRRSTWCSGPRPGGRRAPCSAPPTSSASTRWCTSPRTATTRCPTTSGATCSSRPPVLEQLVAKKWLGDKTKQGFYKKVGDDILQLDLKTLEYGPQKKPRFDSIGATRRRRRRRREDARAWSPATIAPPRWRARCCTRR